MAQGSKTGSDYSHGQMVTYECTTQGYSLVGNPTLTCDDGTWDSQRPQCKGKCFVLYCIICSKLGCVHSEHWCLGTQGPFGARVQGHGARLLV